MTPLSILIPLFHVRLDPTEQTHYETLGLPEYSTLNEVAERGAKIVSHVLGLGNSLLHSAFRPKKGEAKVPCLVTQLGAMQFRIDDPNSSPQMRQIAQGTYDRAAQAFGVLVDRM